MLSSGLVCEQPRKVTLVYCTVFDAEEPEGVQGLPSSFFSCTVLAFPRARARNGYLLEILLNPS